MKVKTVILVSFRQEYYEQMNIIPVEVHFGQSYYFHDGALHSLHNSCPFIQLSVDRQITVAQLLDNIRQEVCVILSIHLLVSSVYLCLFVSFCLSILLPVVSTFVCV